MINQKFNNQLEIHSVDHPFVWKAGEANHHTRYIINQLIFTSIYILASVPAIQSNCNSLPRHFLNRTAEFQSMPMRTDQQRRRRCRRCQRLTRSIGHIRIFAPEWRWLSPRWPLSDGPWFFKVNGAHPPPSPPLSHPPPPSSDRAAHPIASRSPLVPAFRSSRSWWWLPTLGNFYPSAQCYRSDLILHGSGQWRMTKEGDSMANWLGPDMNLVNLFCPQSFRNIKKKKKRKRKKNGRKIKSNLNFFSLFILIFFSFLFCLLRDPLRLLKPHNAQVVRGHPIILPSRWNWMPNNNNNKYINNKMKYRNIFEIQTYIYKYSK